MYRLPNFDFYASLQLCFKLENTLGFVGWWVAFSWKSIDQFESVYNPNDIGINRKLFQSQMH